MVYVPTNTPQAKELRERMQAECDRYPPKTWKREVTVSDLKEWAPLSTHVRPKKRKRHGSESVI